MHPILNSWAIIHVWKYSVILPYTIINFLIFLQKNLAAESTFTGLPIQNNKTNINK